MNKLTDKSAPEPLSTEKGPTKGDTAGKQQNTEQQALSAEVLKLTNEFNVFSADCAFICEAFAAIAIEQQHMEDFTVYGYNRYGLWIKEQVIDFDQRIQKLQQDLRGKIRN